MIPPLPSLSPEWRAVVFSRDKTLPQQQGNLQKTTSLPGIERLVFIGDAVLYLCVTEWLHERSPSDSTAELAYQRKEISSDIPTEWAKRYKLSSQVSVKEAGDPKPQFLTSKGDLFCAYLAAVYLGGGGDHGGLALAASWIKSVLDFEEEEEDSNNEDESSDEPDGKHRDELSGMLKELLVPQSDAPKPKKPVAQTPSMSNTKVETPSSRNSLSILNEKATKRRTQLSWDDVESGPDHAKNWKSTLIAEGKQFEGVGHSKKGARYQAAETALRELKWIS